MDTKTRAPATGAAAPGDEHDDTIDPRIRARRILVKRDEDRTRLGKVVVVLALVTLVAGAVAAMRSPLLDVDHIVVAGAGRTPEQEIVAASGIRRRTSMGDVALGTASRRVATLPWVHRATVRRSWPGTVRIEVTERRPLAQIHRQGGGWLLADRTGRLLARTPVPQPGVVRLSGVAAGAPGTWLSPAWDDALHAAATLPPDLRPQVSEVRRLARDGTGLALQDGLVVALGTGEATGAKLEALRTLLAQPDRHCFASINLQVANAPALTRRPGCA